MPFILHIDDNEIDRLILERGLKKQDKSLEIKSFCDAESAETYLASICKSGAGIPDLIVTDNSMPVKTGFDLVEFIKTFDILGNVPIVMLSSSTLEKDMEKAYSLGVNSFISKPVNPQALNQIIGFLANKD